MNLIDINDELHRLPTTEQVVIELGCGMRKRSADTLGVDVPDYTCIVPVTRT
jgi:hypothetical protein